MTQPDKEPTPPPSRDEQLEDLVDELQQDVTEERRAEGVPDNASDRKDTPKAGSEDEPPD